MNRKEQVAEMEAHRAAERAERLEQYATLPDILQRKLSWDWLVEQLLKRGNVYQLHGQWKAGKSLVALDLSLALAQNQEWCDRRVMQSVVVYVAGEAVEDIEARIQANAITSGLIEDAPFYLRQRPVYLTDQEYAQDLADEISTIRKYWPNMPVFVVVDTLARNFGPGKSESSDADMGAFINNVIDIVVRPHKATALIVHHPGHGAKDRGRGHSSLPGAVDGTLMVEKRDEVIVLTTTEMRNVANTEAELAWTIKPVALESEDNFGNRVTAPVLKRETDIPALNQGANGLGKHQATGLEVLRELFSKATQNKQNGSIPRVPWDVWRDAMKAAGVPRSKTYEVRKSLQLRGLTDEYGEAMTPIEET